MSDFDNFDDLDAVRDFRCLAVPFPGAVDAAVRQRIFELAAERGYGAGAATRWSPSSQPGGVLLGSPDGASTAVVELGPVGPARPRRPHRCMVAVSVGLAVVLSVGLFVRRSTPGESIELGDLGPAGQVVKDQAALDVAGWQAMVEALTDLPLAEDQFAYRKIERGVPGGVIVDGGPIQMGMVRQVQERWASANRPGRLVTTTDRPSGESSAEPAAALPPVSDALAPTEAFAGRSYADLRALPADPLAVAAALDALPEAPAGEWDGLVASVLDHLAEPTVRPDVRGVLVGLLAERGLAPLGPVSDRAGRPGSGFLLDDGTWRWTVVVDTATGRVQGWEVRRGDATVPESYLVVLETTVVPEVGSP